MTAYKSCESPRTSVECSLLFSHEGVCFIKRVDCVLKRPFKGFSYLVVLSSSRFAFV